MAQEKTATCAPRDCYSEGELEETFRSVGRTVTILDKFEVPRCNIRILEVFETLFGNPDRRLVAGEGFGEDIGAFKVAHRQTWHEIDLDANTALIAELFELKSDGH